MKSDALTFWLKTPISSPHCVDRHRALSPCAARKAAFLSQKSCRERKRAESQNAVSLEKVDSSMDRHALQSKARDDRAGGSKARDDRKTRNAPNLNTPQDSRICDEKPLLCKASAEISLEWLSHKRAAAIKGLSRKAESTSIILMALLLSACTTTKEAVYIPTKCKTKDIPKPMPSKESSVSEDVAEILKYTELLERDLEFCKGGEP